MDISFFGVKKCFGTRLVVDIEKLHLPGGQIYCLLGKNGVGKTTLLTMVAGLVRDFEGVIRVGSKPPQAGWDITLVFQQPHMFNMTVYDNIAYGLRARKLTEPQIRNRVMPVCQLLDLKEYLNQNARNLSGGEAKRVAIARAVVLDPAVLLLDEPTSSADYQSKLLICDLVRELNRKTKTTVLMVTHDLTQARTLTKHLLFMDKQGINYEETDYASSQ